MQELSLKQQENLLIKCINNIIFFVDEFIINPYNEATGSNFFITNQQKEGLLAVQNLVHDKMNGLRQGVLGVSIMSGKGCHAKDTSIMMEHGGCRKVQDIEVGDKLMGDDGTPRTVLSLKRGKEQMYRIHISDGSYYDVNESHILSLRCSETGRRGSLKWGKIVNVPVKEYLEWSDRKKKSYCAYKVPVEYNSNTELRIPPYILGLFLGDGDSDSARLINEDKEVIKEWKNYGESLGLNYKCYNKIDHRLVSKKGFKNSYLELLRSYSLINNKHIPTDYMLANRKDRLELLAGLIDTDGCLRKKGAYNYSTTNKNLAESVLFLTRSLGFRGALHRNERIRPKFKKKLSVEYTVNISRGDTEEIPVRIKRKKAVQSKRKDLNFTFKVEKLEVDNYYGFELDGNHLYLLSDFSVTHNTGKDAVTVWVILWFMFCFPNPKIPCISVSSDQLDKVLWSEISKWLSNSSVKEFFVLQSDKLFRKDVDPDVRGKEWFAFKKAANPKLAPNEQVETLQGMHADFMLQVIDEGSGILDPVFNALENNMTGKCNLIFLIFNPMHTKGYAIETQTTRQEDWVCLRWNAEESEIVNQEKVKKTAQRYGIDSNTYRMNVLGLPPKFDEETLINWDWVMTAIDKELIIPTDSAMIKAMDCGAGGDKSIIATRRGNHIYDFKRIKTNDSTELSNWAGNDIDIDRPDCFRVDTIGVGWAVEGLLRDKKGAIVEAADVRRQADNPERFVNKRAEMYWNVRDLFEKGIISIPDDPDLKDQIAATRYELKNGKIQILEKKKIKAEIGQSPDEFDAMALLYYYADNMTSVKTNVHINIKSGKGGWMSA